MLKKAQKNAKLNQQAKLVEFKGQAQTMLDGEWVLAQVIGAYRDVDEHLLTFVELSTGRVVSILIWDKDTAWTEHHLRIQSKVMFRFEERDAIATRLTSLAGFLVPTIP